MNSRDYMFRGRLNVARRRTWFLKLTKFFGRGPHEKFVIFILWEITLNLFLMAYIAITTQEDFYLWQKKITAVVKLQLPAGKATPAPPVGSTLGPHGINIPGFTKEFNAKTADKAGLIIPCVVTIYQDRSFTFVLKTPPTPVLIKKALGIDTASARPNRDKVGKLTKAQAEEIAKTKLPDLNCSTLEAAISMVKGTARSMGVTVEE